MSESWNRQTIFFNYFYDCIFTSDFVQTYIYPIYVEAMNVIVALTSPNVLQGKLFVQFYFFAKSFFPFSSKISWKSLDEDLPFLNRRKAEGREKRAYIKKEKEEEKKYKTTRPQFPLALNYRVFVEHSQRKCHPSNW